MIKVSDLPNPLADVSSRYGAPMGRANEGKAAYPVFLRRVPIDGGGYDPGGAYWGLGGDPLWVAFGENFKAFVRAPDRVSAAFSLGVENLLQRPNDTCPTRESSAIDAAP